MNSQDGKEGTSKRNLGILFESGAYQCSKLRFYIVHTPGAKVGKNVHPAVCPCVFPYKNVLICSKGMHPLGAHLGSEIYAPGRQYVHAGCTLNSNTAYLLQRAHAGLIKSYICFSICKALQSLIFG